MAVKAVSCRMEFCQCEPELFSDLLSIFMRRSEVLHAAAGRIVDPIFAGHTSGAAVLIN
jgi:hypothetical protein